MNCINLDWINGSLQYIHAVNNLRVVGTEVAYFIDVLVVRTVDFFKITLNQLCVITLRIWGQSCILFFISLHKYRTCEIISVGVWQPKRES